MSAWVDQIFKAKQAAKGGIVRRSVDNVRDHDALPEIVERAQDKGWHVIETGGQILVFCHTGALLLHC